MTLEEFHERETSHLKDQLPKSTKSSLDDFKSISTYVSGQYDSPEDFKNLNKHLEEIESKYSKENGGKNRVFYMALPPSVFTTVAEQLKNNCYTKDGQNRIIVEKPFGKDLQSSRDMMGKLKKLWSEDEVSFPLPSSSSCFSCAYTEKFADDICAFTLCFPLRLIACWLTLSLYRSSRNPSSQNPPIFTPPPYRILSSYDQPIHPPFP